MLSGAIILTFLVSCAFAQYNYWDVSPCQSSCGYSRPTSYCQHLPCYGNHMVPDQQRRYYNNPYQRQPYLTYPTYQQQNQNYPFTAGRSSSFSSSRNYGNVDEFANVPVETQDIDYKTFNALNANSKSLDPFANVAVEIIDDPSLAYGRKMNIPLLPKTSSQSSYAVSGEKSVGSSTVHLKPFQTTISRSIAPNQVNPSTDLNIVNGVLVEDSGKTTEVATEVTTTEENEQPVAVTDWAF